jgi:hypothetical protein
MGRWNCLSDLDGIVLGLDHLGWHGFGVDLDFWIWDTIGSSAAAAAAPAGGTK